eukprot:822347-Prorocentrum_lima.AAC.1
MTSSLVGSEMCIRDSTSTSSSFKVSLSASVFMQTWKPIWRFDRDVVNIPEVRELCEEDVE